MNTVGMKIRTAKEKRGRKGRFNERGERQREIDKKQIERVCVCERGNKDSTERR